MMNFVELKKSIVNKLKPLKIPVVSGDIRSGFSKPAFFVQITLIGSDAETELTENEIITVDIHYFSAEKTDLDNVKIADKLCKLFVNSIKVNDVFWPIVDKRFEIEDNVLQFKFDLKFTIQVNEENDDYELMQHLYINGEKEV